MDKPHMTLHRKVGHNIPVYLENISISFIAIERRVKTL